MKKRYKVSLALLTLLTASLIYVGPYVKMNFAESARYTEKDKREYEFYTPELLKHMPRVVKDYEFGFFNVAGPGLLIYELKFRGATDTSQIDEYLAKHGYKKSSICDIQGECWKGPDPKISVSVGVIRGLKMLIISVVVEPSYNHETMENRGVNPESN